MNEIQDMLSELRVVAEEPQFDPELMLFYNNLQDRHLWLEGEITWEEHSFIIKYIQFLNRLDKSPVPKPIHLHIYSNGGEINTTLSLYHAIRNSRIPVYTYNEGACHSGAFIIYLGGEKRFTIPSAVWIAHEGYGNTGGSYRESKAAMKDYERTVTAMKQIIADRTNLSLEQIEQHFTEQQDFYIYPEEAYNYGVITETSKEEKTE